MNTAVALSILLFTPLLFCLAAFGYYLFKYERSRRGQPKTKRLFGDLLGPLSLLFPGIEGKESRSFAWKLYLSGALFFAYAYSLVLLFGP